MKIRLPSTDFGGALHGALTRQQITLFCDEDGQQGEDAGFIHRADVVQARHQPIERRAGLVRQPLVVGPLRFRPSPVALPRRPRLVV